MRRGDMSIRTMLVFVLSLFFCSVALAQTSPVFGVEDLLAVKTFAGGQPFSVSAGGRYVAYVVTDKDDEWNVQEPRPTGHVYVQTISSGQSGAPKPLTSGAVHSSFP